MSGPPTDQVRALLEELVATPSPSGQEADAAGVLTEHLEGWGLEPWTDAAGNVHAARGPEDAPRVLLLGHLDTVPGTWPVRWEDGVLHGRGAVDAKGPLVAYAAALAGLSEPLGLRLHLVAAVGEEVDSPGARHLVETLDPPEALVIAEPTGLATVGLGYKGRVRARLEASRPPAHPGAGEPQAPELILDAIGELTAWTRNAGRDPGIDHATLRVLSLTTEETPEAVTCRAELDLRVPGEAPAGSSLRELLPPEVDLTIDESVDAVRADPRSALATALRGALIARGHTPRQAVKTGTSDWNVVARRWRCPGVTYGPGESELDHTPRERISLTEVEEAACVLGTALARLADAPRGALRRSRTVEPASR